jgi:ABC-type oligopeptide transport system substrate-binding subunit
MAENDILNPAKPVALTPNPAVVDAGANEPTDEPMDQKSYTPEEVEKKIQRRLKNMTKERDALTGKLTEYDALKKDAGEYRKLKESQKSEVERLAGEKLVIEARAQKAEAYFKTLQTDLLRQKLAAKSILPSEWWEDVKGDTEVEVQASITGLVKKLKLDKQRVGGPTPQGGAPVVKANANVNDALFRFVGAGGR